jgi:aquaporin Z
LGTALLVFFAVGVATLMFGLKFDGGSVAAGVIATALTFGLVLLALAYALAQSLAATSTRRSRSLPRWPSG